ncbi:hypothetical protein CspeluHIS016_0106200 [Cutaneotrichosporon spelunceum]|uniref:Tubby C-terminal-like domain-containing protein n=1 Tax=Cutaneotrichosporon spelunceum TaxID=1672016 RepID=A0AAD3TP45_9TREE|nr:hypothetical protein CspeluHIS016_0106200 [Cutaneotrichosporon spelunceum]
MDLFNSAALQLLEPLSPPYEAVRGYVRNEQTTLEISKKIVTLKEETSVVTDGAGRAVVTVTGPAFWLNHFKTVYDGNGTVPLFRMRNKKASMLRLYICEDGRTELFRVQRKWTWWRVKLHAVVPSTVGNAPTLELVGSMSGNSAEIRELHSGALVATLAHSWKMEDVFKNKERYCVKVAAGVDLSVVVALCLAFDQCKEDDRAAGGGG